MMTNPQDDPFLEKTTKDVAYEDQIFLNGKQAGIREERERKYKQTVLTINGIDIAVPYCSGCDSPMNKAIYDDIYCEVTKEKVNHRPGIAFECCGKFVSVPFDVETAKVNSELSKRNKYLEFLVDKDFYNRNLEIKTSNYERYLERVGKPKKPVKDGE